MSVPEPIDAANEFSRLLKSLVNRHCTSPATARCLGKIGRKLVVQGRDGWVKIPTSEWADKAGVSERQAKRIRADLLSEGVIERREGSSGRGNVASYRLKPGGLLSWLVRLCGYRAVTRRFMALVWELAEWVSGTPWGRIGKGDIKGDIEKPAYSKAPAPTPARRTYWPFTERQKKPETTGRASNDPPGFLDWLQETARWEPVQ